MAGEKTVIVTGASQGIGAAIVQAFLERGYNVVATSRNMAKAGLAAVSQPGAGRRRHRPGGDGGEGSEGGDRPKFGSIDHLVNNAGIYHSKPFTEYTADELRAFVSTNLGGFVFVTQLGCPADALAGQGRQRDQHQRGAGRQSHRGAIRRRLPMMTKGGIDAITLSLANEYAKEKIRFNAVAPGVVDTPLHKGNVNARSPMGTFTEPKDIADAVVFLTEAGHVTGEVLHVDDGAHVGQW
jgi:NAD(P)-dependent dehydrogenase (short-subunit alcohol dehydrogenase family)